MTEPSGSEDRTGPGRFEEDSDAEYAGIIAVIKEMKEKRGSYEGDMACAEEAASKFKLENARSNAALNLLLQAIYTLYVSARWAGRYDELITSLSKGKMPIGVNLRTPPIARLIKAQLGPDFQGRDTRTIVSDWAQCLSILLGRKIHHAKIATTIEVEGGYGEIVAKARAARPKKKIKADPNDTDLDDKEEAGDANDADNPSDDEKLDEHSPDGSGGEPLPIRPLAAAHAPIVKSDLMTYLANTSPEVRAAIKTAEALRTPDAVAHLKFLGGGKVNICMAAFRPDAEDIVGKMIERMSKKDEVRDDFEGG